MLGIGANSPLNPLGAEPWRDLDVGLEITLDGIADEGRHFGGH